MTRTKPKPQKQPRENCYAKTFGGDKGCRALGGSLQKDKNGCGDDNDDARFLRFLWMAAWQQRGFFAAKRTSTGKMWQKIC
jgi:hypothetical protein